MGARRQIVRVLVSALEPIVARISELTIEIRHGLDQHPDGATFRSLFIAHDSWLSAATMALRDRRLPRSPTPATASSPAMAASARSRVESGKAKHAQFRWACDHRLRDAFDALADSSRRHNPWAADIYQRARARGASHPHAVRMLGRAWCQVIWRLWQDHDTYNPAKHTARQKLIAAAT
jgi:hypothetical protein